MTKRQDEWLLFTAAFIAFAWFHQGGGWNQNSRFALVRAIAERGTVFIDSYLVYVHAGGPTQLARLDARNAEVEFSGRKFALGWHDEQGRVVPISPAADASEAVKAIEDVGASGDVAYYDGHFHPNKAPGTSFLAVPGYFVVYQLERLAGINPDDWRTLTINAWLASALSVGLLSAFGVVLAYRFGRRLTNDDRRAALVAALALGFGSMFFPYATMLYEHNVAAVLLLAAWYLAHVGRGRTTDRWRLVLSGVCAGYAAVSSYIMAVGGVILFVYLFGAVRRDALFWFAVGVLGPFLLICAYNVACFGTPFATNYQYENPMFVAGNNAPLGVFVVPSASVLVAILVSPFRGLFLYSPVLIVGVAGLVWMFRTPGGGLRADAWVAVAMIVFMLLFNTTFNGWSGGWASGPRYLLPALPFLTVPIALAYRRLPRVTNVLLGLSCAVFFVTTAVDAQPAAGAGGLATVPGRAQWTYSPLVEYELPLLLRGRAYPILNQMTEYVLRRQDQKMTQDGRPPEERRAAIAKIRAQIDTSITKGIPSAFYLAEIRGPVSVNPIGVYESTFNTQYGPGERQTSWNSFNVGEFLFPRSILSLIPLLVLAGFPLVTLWRESRMAPVSVSVS